MKNFTKNWGLTILAVALLVAPLAGMLVAAPHDSVLGIKDNTFRDTYTFSGQIIQPIPAAQTVGAGEIVTADACGGIKRIHANGTAAVTTDTTNTFTAPSASLTGCSMVVINSGTGTDTGAVTLDDNGNFYTTGNLALGVGDSAHVVCDGTYWYLISTSNN